MAKIDTELYQELQQQKKEEYERTTGEKLEKDPVISNTEYKSSMKNLIFLDLELDGVIKQEPI